MHFFMFLQQIRTVVLFLAILTRHFGSSRFQFLRGRYLYLSSIRNANIVFIFQMRFVCSLEYVHLRAYFAFV